MGMTQTLVYLEFDGPKSPKFMISIDEKIDGNFIPCNHKRKL